MPLLVQVKSGETWRSKTLQMPGENLRSISDNKPGKPQVYMLLCSEDDGCSKLLRSKHGFDIADKRVRYITSDDFEIVKVLRSGESHDLEIVTPSGQQSMLRFTHVIHA